MINQGIQFFVRICPTTEIDWNNVKVDVKNKTIHVRTCQSLKGYGNANAYWQFKTDGIYVNVSQEEFYEAVVPKDLLEKAFGGIDTVILPFGSSGTGKTYSIFGLYNRYEYRGIAPRILQDVFKYKEKTIVTENVTVLLSYVEIVGKNIHNLLLRGKPVVAPANKIFDGTQAIRVNDEYHGLDLIFKGDERRKFEKTETHCGTTIVTIELKIVSVMHTNPVSTSAKIHIIDTAGIDYGYTAIKSVKCHSEANLTKCYLNTLCSWIGCNLRKFDTTPSFRTSTLAVYLGHSINNGYIRLLGHIETRLESIPLIISTLKFGTRLRRLPAPMLVKAKTKNAEMVIENLKAQIAELEENYNAKQILEGAIRPGSLSKDQLAHVIEIIRTYLKSAVDEGTVLNLAHPTLLLPTIRNIYNGDISQLQNELSEMALRIGNVSEDNRVTRKTKPSRISIKQTRMSSNRSLVPPTSKQGSPKKKRASNSKIMDTKRNMTAILKQSMKKPLHSQNSMSILDLSKEDVSSLKAPYDVETLLYDFSQMDLETAVEGEINKEKIFQELLNLYPPVKKRIELFENDIKQNFIEKSQLMTKLTNLKSEINQIRIQIEHEQWLEEMQTCDVQDGPDVVRASKEICMASQTNVTALENELENKVDEFNLSRLALIDKHYVYMAAMAKRNEIQVDFENQLNEYTKTLYDTTLLIPPEETVKEISKAVVIQEETGELDDIKNHFIRLQKRI